LALGFRSMRGLGVVVGLGRRVRTSVVGAVVVGRRLREGAVVVGLGRRVRSSVVGAIVVRRRLREGAVSRGAGLLRTLGLLVSLVVFVFIFVVIRRVRGRNGGDGRDGGDVGDVGRAVRADALAVGDGKRTGGELDGGSRGHRTVVSTSVVGAIVVRRGMGRVRSGVVGAVVVRRGRLRRIGTSVVGAVAAGTRSRSSVVGTVVDSDGVGVAASGNDRVAEAEKDCDRNDSETDFEVGHCLKQRDEGLEGGLRLRAGEG